MKGAIHEPMEGLYGPGLPLVQQCLFQFEVVPGTGWLFAVRATLHTHLLHLCLLLPRPAS